MVKKAIILFGVCLLFILGYNYAQHLSTEPYRKGVSAFKTENYSEAIKLLEPLAKQGHLKSRRLMARIYILGLGVQANTTIAKEWLSCNEIKGCISGKTEYHLALLFCNKNNSLFNKERAKYWMKESSSKGFHEADAWLKNELSD